LALVLIVVTLSNSGAVVAIVIGLGAILAHLILAEHPADFANVFPRGGSILMFGA
jgi:hypothetical protein